MRTSLTTGRQMRPLRTGSAISWATRTQPPRRPGKHGVLLLAALPILDPVLNQIHTAYPLAIGPLSLLQATRGAVLMAAVWVAATLPRRGGRIGRSVGRLTIVIGICVAVLAMNDVLSRGLEINNIIAYVQIAYWLTIWYVAIVAVTDAWSARTVAKGLVIGALITAASVYFGYATDVETLYSRAGVEASSGWFVSPKGIAGSLVAGAFIVVYLGYRRHPWGSALIALFCLGGSFLTYARAGMVAMCVALAWLATWSIGTRFSMRSSWAVRLVLLSVCGAAIVAATLGTAGLMTRWADLDDPDKAGSGRLLLWTAAVRGFLGGSVDERLFGRGFQGMLDMVYDSLGVAVHTHNDVLDMLVIGGVLGLIVLGLVFAGILVQIRAARAASPEFAVAVAVLLVLGCQAFFTGQLFLPDIMTFYLLGITAVLACAPPITRNQLGFVRGLPLDAGTTLGWDDPMPRGVA